jgi:hypothetical protein
MVGPGDTLIANPVCSTQNLGRVHEDGRMHYHIVGRPDEYMGRIAGEMALVHAGAAFLLLVWPAFAEEQEEETT